ncbi:putative nucleotidyl transferase [Methanocella paludicola SANAE]|uniref:Nucleotidyl transferase n=1 Tax=Methanocella paludicola (strain DSM 17711 / JCM 13418 / NBRC 101707 / SANAE) TaxID=304371 RepID=D1YZ11_METPS|nr:nucleotidyltransferase domain-containing protein [Methanocella paludicola]BAI61683.1 putative nucleotidyl transferase [Methanocella paludicola SANAE]
MFDQDTRNDLELIKEAINKELPDVEAIYLFGSVARGNYRKESDYDILVLVNDLPDNKIKRISRIRYGLLGKIKRPLELFILGTDELEFSSPFLYEVYHNHKQIYGKDVMSRYKDIAKKMRPFVLNGVKVGYYV